MQRTWRSDMRMRLNSATALKLAMIDAGMRPKHLKDPKNSTVGEGSAELASYIGKSRQFVYQLLSGQIRDVLPETAHRIEFVLLGPEDKRSSLTAPLFLAVDSKRVRKTHGRKKEKTAA